MQGNAARNIEDTASLPLDPNMKQTTGRKPSVIISAR